MGVQTAFAVHPDIPRHYQYRQVVFENLADEILNSAAKQNVHLYRNQILTVVQHELNPVLDEMLLQASNYAVCPSTDQDCINGEYKKLLANSPGKIENNFFNFYNYQTKAWTYFYIAPKQGWPMLNEWYGRFIETNFALKSDSLTYQNTNTFYLNSRVMCYRLKEEMNPEMVHVSKSLFNAYYNHCVYLLKSPSIISYEYFSRTAEVDSIMNIALEVKQIGKENLADAANVYIAAAFNDDFPAGIEKEDLVALFREAESLLNKAMSIQETGKVHYALGALYNNFLIDYSVTFTSNEKLELFGRNIIPSQIMEESVTHLEDACALDNEYCNLRKFRDRRKIK